MHSTWLVQHRDTLEAVCMKTWEFPLYIYIYISSTLAFLFQRTTKQYSPLSLSDFIARNFEGIVRATLTTYSTIPPRLTNATNDPKLCISRMKDRNLGTEDPAFPGSWRISGNNRELWIISGLVDLIFSDVKATTNIVAFVVHGVSFEWIVFLEQSFRGKRLYSEFVNYFLLQRRNSPSIRFLMQNIAKGD